MKKERSYGLDILRILSMLGIVGLHILNQGGWSAAANSSAEILTSRIFAAICYCSVDVFAMLTGFLYAGRISTRFSNLYKLLLTTVFYCASILLIFIIVAPSLFVGHRGLYLYAIFPPLAGRYWYITSYILLFLMIPCLNAMVRSLPQVYFRRLLLVSFFLLSVATTFGLNDYFKVSGGYSPFWLMFCYLIGAYIKLYGTAPTRHNTLTYTMMLALDLAIMLVLGYLLDTDLFPITNYVSPFIVVEAALLLLIFRKITIHASWLRTTILSLSNAAFGVYIIHSHIMVFDHVIHDAFAWTADHTLPVYFAAMLVGLVGIYLLCWIIEQLRGLLFRWLRIDRLADWLGKKTDDFLHLD